MNVRSISAALLALVLVLSGCAATPAPATTPTPPSLATPKKVLVNCHYCGYAPEGEIPLAGACPKCGGSSWERFAPSMRLVPPEMGGLRKEQA